MKFYDREIETEELEKLEKQSYRSACFSVIVGRRRIGKTSLLMHAYNGINDMIYLFVSRNSEGVLCQDFKKDIDSNCSFDIVGHPVKISEIIEQLFQRAQSAHVTLVIDEFQELRYVNPSIFSEIQHLWDVYHDHMKMNLVVCGSIYSMMHKIFEDAKEPLFGRMTAKMTLKPFHTDVLKQILRDVNPKFTSEDLLCLYLITGGVPMYVSLLIDAGAVTRDSMLDYVCSPSSRFLSEATEMLIGEFGKQYNNYFGILQLIAEGMTAQQEIDSVIGKNTGSYLSTLENEYSLISKNLPYGCKPGARNIRWHLNDNFLMFWFRFIAPNRQMVETGKMQLLRDYIEMNYTQYSGLILERYFRQKYSERERVTDIASWWDNNGENEIDLIAVERLDRKVTIAEIKRNPQKYSSKVLNEKAEKVLPLFRNYKKEIIGLSMEDM
jgi:AAA+ ATPase superfamily predicted ATPase